MKYKYRLTDALVEKVSYMDEFANGATQVTIVTKDGNIHKEILISNSTYIIAMKNHKDLPFDIDDIDDIDDIFQTDDDRNPKTKGGWDFWDKW